MNQALVSVIIPVYNAEKYIAECIESIINQTYKNIEIILVDDGSVDKSYEICGRYASLYQNIAAVSQKNQGSSVARNVGISMASGQYLCFVDADDYATKEMIEILVNGIETNDADLIVCNHYIHDKEKDRPRHSHKIGTVIKNTKKDVEFVQLQMLCMRKIKENPYVFTGYPWARIYKKSIIDENRLLFPEEVKRTEDAIFNLYYWQFCKKIMYISEPLFFYRILETSITNAYNPQIVDITEKDFEATKEFAYKYKSEDFKFKEMIDVKICMWTYLYLSKLYFHSNYIEQYGYKKAREELNKVLNKELYINAFANVKYRNMSIKEKVYVWMLKHKLYFILFIWFSLIRK